MISQINRRHYNEVWTFFLKLSEGHIYNKYIKWVAKFCRPAKICSKLHNHCHNQFKIIQKLLEIKWSVRFKCCFHQLMGRCNPSYRLFDWPDFPEGEDTECPHVDWNSTLLTMSYYFTHSYTHYCQQCCQDGLHKFCGLHVIVYVLVIKLFARFKFKIHHLSSSLYR